MNEPPSTLLLRLQRDCGVLSWFRAAAVSVALLFTAPVLFAGGGALEIRQGYFWDPTTARFFYPHGIAYQSWNPDVGANQSLEQVGYDMLEFKKMRANSVRAEMVWSVIQTGPATFDWSKSDYLVDQAEKLGLKLFVLIGFQYAPAWVPDEWKALNSEGHRSKLLCYENSQARGAYANYIKEVASRYRNRRAIGAWILGNEYAYFDLWETNRLYLGYDSNSVASFHSFLRQTYQNDIVRARATWGTNYLRFEDVAMPRAFPPKRDEPLFHDLIQWRKRSIGDYVAVGARAARQADPNHLLTYSMIGGLFGEQDMYYTCEDGRSIVQACKDAGVPLDFWSINNYAIAAMDTELRSGDFGIAKHKADTGLPVLLSETGHTSTENLHVGASERQAAAVPTQLWESVVSGAMGVHVFTWNDRHFFAGDYFPREEGFGIVHYNRRPKDPVFFNVARVFERMEELDIANLIAGTTNPPPDIQIFWPSASDIGWPRANHELIRTWSTLKRLGYEPNLIYNREFEAGVWRSGRALLLSRAFHMEPAHLDTVANAVVAAGIHVHAAVDLPGEFDAHHRTNLNWNAHMRSLFGLQVDNATPAFDSFAITTPDSEFRRLDFVGTRAYGPIPANYTDAIETWKFWKGISVAAGTTIVKHSGNQPALHLNNLGSAKTAVTPLALGDIRTVGGQAQVHSWDLRYQWLQAIYRNHFGIAPTLDLSGQGAAYIFPGYRVCRNGSVLVGLFNGNTVTANVVLKAPSLLTGRTIENLTDGGILEVNSDGQIALSLAADQYVLLYATTGAAPSLVNPTPVKLWFESAPSAVWPDGQLSSVVVGYDIQGPAVTAVASFETADPIPRSYGVSEPKTLSGRGQAIFTVPIPDPDLNNGDYVSSSAGGQYVWRVRTSSGSTPVSLATPVRLAWGVRPAALPNPVQSGKTYGVTVNWEELTSYLEQDLPTSLDRASLWDSLAAEQQHYAIVLELQSNGATVAHEEFITDSASGSHEFQIRVPLTAKGPFSWTARAQTADEVSNDITDGFEARSLGADTALPQGSPLRFAPWSTYNYQQNPAGGSLYFDTGTQLEGFNSAQSAFLIYTNPPSVGLFSGFGLERQFPAPFAMPPTLPQWHAYTFSCDVREINGQRMNVGLQLKSPPGSCQLGGQTVHAVQFLQPYTSTNGDWQHISATLDLFRQPDFLCLFDINNAVTLVLNFEMLDTETVYHVMVDNIRWDAPEHTGVLGPTNAVYFSANDSAAPPLDADKDGVADAFETATGIYVSDTNTGTRPDRADSDGDGQSDGDELVSGTNPNLKDDFFHIDSVRLGEAGEPVLSWKAKAGRAYSVAFAEELTEPGSEFFPVPGLTALSASADGPMDAKDLSPPPATTRFYRVMVIRP
ncbi:MAG TPA: beta-galactosidase [Verrucomicrobiota bacterium]|nr:beta-galactosidase [Verrucomicrobiota bacterium]